LTGNQTSGDHYVIASLEALAEDPASIDETGGARVALYKVFTRIWNSIPVNGETGPVDDEMPADARLASLTPLPRQAFLLVALEGFAEEDAARILDVDIAKLRALVEESGRELAREIATDVLIIEDEMFIAMDLESLVQQLGHNVIGVARTHGEAVEITKKKKPGLILADIQERARALTQRIQRKAALPITGEGGFFICHINLKLSPDQSRRASSPNASAPIPAAMAKVTSGFRSTSCVSLRSA